MSADPLTREERASIDHQIRRDCCGGSECSACETLVRYEATVQAAEERAEDWMRRGLAAVERAEKAEERAERLRVAIRDARGLYDQALMESRFGVAHHLRVSADKILHDALNADDAARGDQ